MSARRSALGVACAALLLAAAPHAARGGDVSGVYVSGPGARAETLHLQWADDEVVGRFVTQEGTWLLEGWLDEPGYMGTMFDSQAPDRGLLYFIAAPVAEGMKLSLFNLSENGEMDFERPLRTWELRLAPDRRPEIPAELIASLGGDGDALEDAEPVRATPMPPGAAERSGGGMPLDPGGTAPVRGGGEGGAPPGGGGAFHGPFHGDDGRGGIAMLQFVQQGDRVQGELSAFGATARLEGTVRGQAVEGRLQAIDATGTFKGTLSGQRLSLTCVLRGESGETTVPLQLERGQPAGELDPRLVGRWVKSSSYTSGDFSVATSQTCVIRPDGTLTLFDGRMAGGGDAGSFDSGAPEGSQTSRWFTKGNLLYVNGQLYARYGFSGQTLGLWFSENGKPEIWSRQ